MSSHDCPCMCIYVTKTVSLSTAGDTGREKGIRFAGSADAPEPHVCWHWACSNSAVTQLTVLGFVPSPVYLLSPHLQPGCRSLMWVQSLPLWARVHSKTVRIKPPPPPILRMEPVLALDFRTFDCGLGPGGNVGRAECHVLGQELSGLNLVRQLHTTLSGLVQKHQWDKRPRDVFEPLETCCSFGTCENRVDFKINF